MCESNSRSPGFFVTVACRSLPADLTPASGRQDHTALPSAAGAFVSCAAASIASRLNVRDDRETPLLVRRDDGKCEADLGSSAMPKACDRLTRRAIFASPACPICRSLQPAKPYG